MFSLFRIWVVYINKKVPVCWGLFFAEEEGFEPPEVLPSTVFKTAAIDHSAIPPQ